MKALDILKKKFRVQYNYAIHKIIRAFPEKKKKKS